MRLEALLLLAAFATAALAIPSEDEFLIESKEQFAIESNKDADLGIDGLEDVRSPGYTRVFDYPDGRGNGQQFNQYLPNLSVYNWANRISSACVRGLWFFYDYNNYNTMGGGSVKWTHGVDYCANFNNMARRANSLRFGGSPRYLNDDSFTLYEGRGFIGNEFFARVSCPRLKYMDLRASSLLLTGRSAWTFYSGLGYRGQSVCVYPSTDHDVGQDGTRVDFGMFPQTSDAQIPENSIRSVARGCHSSNVVYATPLEATHKSDNGAMGVLNMTLY